MRPCSIFQASLLVLLPHLTSAKSHDVEHAASGTEAPIALSTQTLTSQFFPKHASERIKVRYGPYNVPPMHTDNGMVDFGARGVPAPCTDCLITYMHAGLEYPDGTPADASTGMWLHHTVWTNLMRESATCPGRKHGDRFFASGNERTPVDLTARGTVPAGYEVEEGDVIAMGGELMNMRHEAREVVLTMTWEFVPRVPRGFRRVRSYWLDVGGCRTSSVEAKEDAAWAYESEVWKSEDRGRVLFTASHLHNGGTHTEIRQGGKVICNSEAVYGTCHDGDAADDRHIESLSACTDVGKARPNDEWSITAYYNTSKHAPMRNMDGSLEPVMGISLVYVGLDDEESHGHRKLKIVLGFAVLTLSATLAAMWARLNGGLWWPLRKQGVSLGDVDTKSGWSLLGERYRDDA